MPRRTPLALGLAGAAVLALAGCASPSAGTNSPGSQVTPAADGVEVNFLELGVGDCFNIPSGLADGIALKFSSCEVPHVFEAYSEQSLPEGPFPGNDRVDQLANAACEPAFVAFVGESWQRSNYDFQYIVPSQATWSDSGDRAILCLVTRLDGMPFQGSARGTGA